MRALRVHFGDGAAAERTTAALVPFRSGFRDLLESEQLIECKKNEHLLNHFPMLCL